MPFNETNRKVIVAIQNGISSLTKEKAGLLAQLDSARGETTAAEDKLHQLSLQHQEELARLQQQYEGEIGSEKKQRELSQQQQREIQQRFEFVQSLFDPAEASVFLQRQNVIIAAHGFSFPPGQSQLNDDNFPLLNKIVQSIGKFPKSAISVQGHTDSTGSTELNQKLSEERAAVVAKFLINIGGIDSARITAQGFGKERPLASNETKEGRAANRRVEIQILNN